MIYFSSWKLSGFFFLFLVYEYFIIKTLIKVFFLSLYWVLSLYQKTQILLFCDVHFYYFNAFSPSSQGFLFCFVLFIFFFVSIFGILIIYYIDPPSVLFFSTFWVAFLCFLFYNQKDFFNFIFQTFKNSFLSLTSCCLLLLFVCFSLVCWSYMDAMASLDFLKI